MKKIVLRTLGFILAVTMALSSISLCFAYEGDETSSVSPFKIEICTNKDSFSVINIVKFNVKVTNTSDNPLENISAEVLLDTLLPIGKNSTLSVEADSLAVGESLSFGYNALLDNDKVKVNLFQDLILNIIRFFGQKDDESNNNSDDNRLFVDEVKHVPIGGVKASSVVRVWYGEPVSQEDRALIANDGVAPYVAIDEEDDIPSFLIGRFTQRTILDEQDVYDAISDISDILDISNVSDEFLLYQTDTFDSACFYRFKQIYNGIEVYSKNLNVSVDKDGKVSSISCDYDPIETIDLTVNYNEAQAAESLKQHLAETETITDIEKAIYPDEENSHVLSWKITTTENIFFVSCADGSLVSSRTTQMNEKATASGSFDGETYTFSSWKEDGTYYLLDASRNIVSVNSKGSTLESKPCVIDSDGTVYYYNSDSKKWYINGSFKEVQVDAEASNYNITVRDKSGEIIGRNAYKDIVFQTTNIFDKPEVPYESSSNQWTNEKAVKTYVNTISTYDYYLNNFGRKGFNGKNGQMYVAFDDNIKFDTTNAYSSTVWLDNSVTLLSFGKENSADIDVVAHEFTHSVENSISGMEYSKLSGALMEAYSDIMGEVVEASLNNGVANWIMFNRDMRNPTVNNYPDKYKGSNWADLSGGDHGGVHTNCTVVSHAAYLMNTTGISDTDELGELWYRSLFYLQSNASFYDCRAAVMAAARDMGFDAVKLNCISNAFDAVDINRQSTPLFTSGNSKIAGKVVSADTERAITDATVIAKGSGLLNITSSYTDTNGNFILSGIKEGTYSVSVKAAGYLENTIQVTVPSNDETVYLEHSIMLNSEYDGQNGLIAGVIRNAINNNSVAGATIRFRKGHGIKSGEYVLLSGNPVEVTSSYNGSYSCNALKTGYYTAEVSCNNYITGYFNVIVSPSNDICKNQNFSITPVLPEGQYRIVLTWGANPQDLDSHITGPLSNGSEFHVYFSNKNAYDGSSHAANLDIDDTSGFGPETITLEPTTDGTYRYFIYHFSGSGSVSTSGAQVKLYKGNSLIASYNAPTDQGTGKYWSVFEISDGEIRNINRIGNSVYTG